MHKLLQCSLCNQPVSSRARVCPHCGDYIRAGHPQTVTIAGAITTGFYLAAGFWLFSIFIGIAAGLVMLVLFAIGVMGMR